MSDGDQALRFVYLMGVLILVASGLFVRRAPIGQTLKMVLAWVLIFGAGFAIFALKDDFKALGSRILAEATGDARQQVEGGELRIRASQDGHFWIDGEVNGHAVRFLVDSGATVTTLTRATAASAGVEASSGFGVMVRTANGPTIVDRGEAARLRIGPIERSDFAVQISGNLDDNLLGMNFLSSLRAWRVDGRILVLKP